MRLASIPGVCHGLPKTQQGILEALHRYETANSDLDPHVRRMLGVCAMASYFGRKKLETALGKLPLSPFRDSAWRWWNILVSSGLEEHWEKFAELGQNDGLRAAAADLQKRIPRESYLLLLRRAGTNPYNSSRKPSGRYVWTKGGNWAYADTFTKLLVLKLHLPERRVWLRWQRKLGPEGARLLEKELMHSVNPDAVLRYQAVQQAISYVTWRLPQLLKTKRHCSPNHLAWFFQTVVLDTDEGHTVAIHPIKGYTRTAGLGGTTHRRF